MYTLYNILQIKKSASKRDMIKSHQRLYKKYTEIDDQNKLVEINKALTILSKPLNRKFYDLYGDKFIFLINHSNITYMLLNVATLKNIIYMLIYTLCTLIYFCFYFTINLALKDQLYLVKNSIYIFGSLFLILSLINCIFCLGMLKNYFKIFYFYMIIPLIFSVKLIIICFYLDGIINKHLAIANMIICSLFMLLTFYLKEKNDNLSLNTYIMKICSEFSLGLCFIDKFKLYMVYIPIIYLFFFNFYHHKIFQIIFIFVAFRTAFFIVSSFLNYFLSLLLSFIFELIIFLVIIIIFLKLKNNFNLFKTDCTSCLEKLPLM